MSVSQDDGDGSKKQAKKTPNDFIFGKVIGEGSYSTVYLAKEIETGTEFAIKVLEKRHIMREKKTQYVMREKEVLMKMNHPFIIRLFYTFQDTDRLYFVLNYAERGELLDYLHKLSSFDLPCSRWYAAEIVLALEYMHNLNFIHRDLKPENILLNKDMHIQITDFGSAKILNKVEETKPEEDNQKQKRKNSFVGTAQYVSPEVLTSKQACSSSDLWALGCIIYQLLSGLPPFRGGHEFQIFQKIQKLEYEFPDGFDPVARDLVEKLLVIEPTRRLGCDELGGIEKLKSHPFFEGIDWAHLAEKKPPELLPYLPATKDNPDQLWSRPGFDDKRIVELITNNVNICSISEDERLKQLEDQKKNNPYHNLVEGNLIIKQGLVDKRKGLFAKRRMLLLTEGPHLYYVDPSTKILKGQIPWSEHLRPEAKNFKTFFIHTPNRTYYLEDKKLGSQEWVQKVEEVWRTYYGDKKSNDGFRNG